MSDRATPAPLDLEPWQREIVAAIASGQHVRVVVLMPRRAGVRRMMAAIDDALTRLAKEEEGR